MMASEQCHAINGLRGLAAVGVFMLAVMATAPAALANGAFIPPEGCTTWLTVQSRQCRVSNYYKCDRDPPGHQWRADFDQQGIFFISRIDAEAQWVESFDLFPTVRQTLDPDPEDPASFTELLEGLDTFAFNLTKEDGRQSRVRGFDRLTGRSVTIDSVVLKETEFEFEETDTEGNLLRRSRGREYIHPEWRSFFAGPSEYDGGAGYVPVDGSPVSFAFPGDRGFQSTQPIYECEVVISGDPQGVVRAGF